MSEDQPREDFEFDWPSDIGDEERAELMAWAEARGIQPDMFRRVKSRAGSESFAAPPVFFYVDGEGQLVFIRDLGLEGLLHLPDGIWAHAIPAAPKLPLSRARRIYGADLAGYERTYRVIAPGAAGGITAKRIDYSVQLFVKYAGQAS